MKLSVLHWILVILWTWHHCLLTEVVLSRYLYEGRAANMAETHSIDIMLYILLSYILSREFFHSSLSSACVISSYSTIIYHTMTRLFIVGLSFSTYDHVLIKIYSQPKITIYL